MASRLGPAHPRGITWNGAGAWLIFSQSRQENFSRTVSITFHWRGTDSSVRVTSSPSLRKPTAAAAFARRRRIDHHPLARKMVGERVALSALARKSANRRRLGDCLAPPPVRLPSRRFQLFERQRQLVDQPRRALRSSVRRPGAQASRSASFCCAISAPSSDAFARATAAPLQPLTPSRARANASFRAHCLRQAASRSASMQRSESYIE